MLAESDPCLRRSCWTGAGCDEICASSCLCWLTPGLGGSLPSCHFRCSRRLRWRASSPSGDHFVHTCDIPRNRWLRSNRRLTAGRCPVRLHSPTAVSAASCESTASPQGWEGQPMLLLWAASVWNRAWLQSSPDVHEARARAGAVPGLCARRHRRGADPPRGVCAPALAVRGGAARERRHAAGGGGGGEPAHPPLQQLRVGHGPSPRQPGHTVRASGGAPPAQPSLLDCWTCSLCGVGAKRERKECIHAASAGPCGISLQGRT